MCICLSRIKTCGREIRMIRGIRILLCLQSKSFPVVQGLAVLAYRSAVKEVAAVELHCRLVSENFHISAAGRLIDRSRELDAVRRLAVEHPVMVITSSVFKLLVIVIDSLPSRYPAP